jgi:hypothetical protein
VRHSFDLVQYIYQRVSADPLNALVPITMFGWPLVVVLLFLVLPPRQAVIAGMLGAWLFLPMASYELPGIPNIDKMSITCLSVFVCAVILDPSKFMKLRWNWVDIALLAWVLVPLPSAINEGYGAYEGASGVLSQGLAWGLPYLLGRLYFSDAEGLQELALGLFIAGLAYVPFVVYEAWMSPRLHKIIYGFRQHSFSQALRGDGYRPMVFMQHGLAVAMMMGTSAVCGICLWTVGKVRVLWHVPISMLAIGLIVVAASCRSSYAMMLMMAGLAALIVSRWINTKLILIGLLSIAPIYLTARTFGGWDAQLLRSTANLMGEDRAGSFGVRLDSEDAMLRWIRGDMLLGRSRLSELMDADPKTWGRFIPDGLWLIALGKNGLVGLTALFCVLLLPPLVYLNRNSVKRLWESRMAGATAMLLVLVLYAMDNLLNAMINPIYLLASGGLPTLLPISDKNALHVLQETDLNDVEYD